MKHVKPQELRLGNYINIVLGDQRNFTTLVVSMLGSEVHAQTLNGKNVAGLYNDFVGIPLTEEWLLKFGFETGGYDLIERRLDKFWIAAVYSDNETEFGICHNGEIDVMFKYVHQLQNFYFALTGEELTIKQLV